MKHPSHRLRRFFALEIENRRIFEGNELNLLKSAILITRLNPRPEQNYLRDVYFASESVYSGIEAAE